MMTEIEVYQYRRFMGEAKFYLNEAEKFEENREFLLAQSRYMSALTEYENAYKMVENIKDFRVNIVYDKIQYCSRKIFDMAIKYDRELLRNYENLCCGGEV